MKKLFKWILLVFVSMSLILLSIYSYIYSSHQTAYLLATFILLGIALDIMAITVFSYGANRLSADNSFPDDCLTKYFCEPLLVTITKMHDTDTEIGEYKYTGFEYVNELGEKEEGILNIYKPEKYKVGDQITLYILRGYNHKGNCIVKKYLLNKPNMSKK